ncbi:MAG: HNH endonuclease, partial [Treponema sp.]|nr:HNH endonuclease [Treponema sp.]
VALNQTRTVVNALIKQYGKPSQIALELSRDLKASREAKDSMLKKQNENKKRNEILNKNITDAYKIAYPNRNDRLKYRLWEELGAEGLPRKCIYCGKNISGAELFSKSIEIEHILPYSRTLLDAESNLTVAHASCNAFKKERSPYEAFGSNPSGYNWNEILARANQLKNPAKRGRFSVDAMETFEKESGFIAHQLTDNAYLSKMALRYLKSVCDNIWSVNGGMTKLLRDKWEIDSILKRKIDEKEIAYFGLKDEQIGEYKKNRYDHRHHALDASVIALIDRSLVKEISTLNARSQKNRIEVPPMAVPRIELQEKVKNIVVSFKPDHGAEGKLSKETLLGKIKREEVVELSKIEEGDIPFIKNEKVRGDFESKFAESKDIKKVRKEFKDIYPQVKIFRECFVSRSPIASLKENNIGDTVDVKIRSRLQDFYALHKGEKFEDVLQKFSEETKIKKVRCLNRVQTPIVINSEVPRYLAPEDYFAAIIWQIPPKKDGAKPTYEAQYIRRN